jgi:hypothetical protein
MGQCYDHFCPFPSLPLQYFSKCSTLLHMTRVLVGVVNLITLFSGPNLIIMKRCNGHSTHQGDKDSNIPSIPGLELTSFFQAGCPQGMFSCMVLAIHQSTMRMADQTQQIFHFLLKWTTLGDKKMFNQLGEVKVQFMHDNGAGLPARNE